MKQDSKLSKCNGWHALGPRSFISCCAHQPRPWPSFPQGQKAAQLQAQLHTQHPRGDSSGRLVTLNFSVLFSQVHVLPIKFLKCRDNQVVGLRTHFYLICLLLKTETLSPPPRPLDSVCRWGVQESVFLNLSQGDSPARCRRVISWGKTAGSLLVSHDSQRPGALWVQTSPCHAQ